MSFEIDFLPVGQGQKGGDAICFRYGDFTNRNNFNVIVIDGGTIDSGKKLVEHVKNHYNTNRVDIALLTHPDCDHASGMREVLNGLDVRNLGMHLPWERAENVKHLFVNNNISSARLKKAVKENLEIAHEVHVVALQKKINIFSPFSDYDQCKDYNIKILSPSVELYDSLICDFTATPDSITESALSRIYKSTKETMSNFIDEKWDYETLENPDDNGNNGTRPENNSSLVFLLEHDDMKFLFTSDAGVLGLYGAYTKAQSLGINLQDVNFIQIPHHGSKRNVGPDILDLIVGNIVDRSSYTGGNYKKTGLISCPAEDNTKHPSKKVINAFIRRGVKVLTTKGSSILYHSIDAPNRNWETAVPEQFFYRVEDD